MDLLFYLRVVRKGWRLILLCALLGTAAAAFATLRATPVYESSTKLFIAGQPAGDAQSALASGSLSQQRIASYADLVTSSPVVDEVFTEVGLPRGSATVQAAPLENTLILVVTVQDSDARRAALIANGFGEVVPEVVERTEQPANGAASPIQASVTQPAFVPAAPVSPKPRLNISMGLILGLLIGGAFALLRETLDTSIKNVEDVERAAPGVSLLGTVFFSSDNSKNRVVTVTNPRSPDAEAFRQLRTNVQFARIDSAVKSLVVTSALPGEGKSTVSANLAIALAQAGQRVVLVEADLRRPSLAEYLGFEQAVGLTDVLIGRVPLEDVLQEFGPEPRLAVLPCGPIPPNPSEVLGSHAMQELIGSLEAIADVVIFDTPPLLPVTDAAVLAAHTAGALIVVRANKTTRVQVSRSLAALQAVGATPLGVTLNFVRAKDDARYGYRYGARPDLPTLDSAPSVAMMNKRSASNDSATVDVGRQASSTAEAPTVAGPAKSEVSYSDSASAEEEPDVTAGTQPATRRY